MTLKNLALLSAVTLGCSAPVPLADAGCDKMFGRPVEGRTGMNITQCAPSCSCGGSGGVSTPDFTQAQFDALLAWQLETPFAELTANPYDAPVPTREPGVCAMVVTDAAAKNTKCRPSRARPMRAPRAAR